MELNRHGFAVFIARPDFIAWRDIISMDRLVIIFKGMSIGFRRAFVIIKGDAGRNDINHRKALMFNAGFDEGYELGLIAGKTTRDKSGADG